MKKVLSLFLCTLLVLSTLSVVFPALPLLAGADETPDAVDLSTTIHLPPVGDQGQIGCCASMAITYMQFTNAVSRYLHHADPTVTWDPSSGDPKYCFSPKFTYLLAGSGTAWVYEVLKEQGCLTQDLSAFSGGPTGYSFNNVLAKDWETDEGLWSLAQNYRVTNYDQVWLRNVCTSDFKVTTTDAGRALLERIKESLRHGDVVVTGGYVSYWQNALAPITGTGTYGRTGDLAIPYSATGDSSAGGHQVAIIGYDDDITCEKNGVLLKGAFKIINSYGTGWQNDGCLWLMYDAFNGAGQSEYDALNVEDRIWTMDQVVFLNWETDIAVGAPALTTELYLTGTDRDAFTVTLTGTERSNGSVISYTPYIFSYLSRRPGIAAGVTFNGRSGNSSSGVITLNYDQLFVRIPSGKTVDDYDWGFKITGRTSGTDTVVNRAVLKKNGSAVALLTGPDDVVSYGTTKSYVFSSSRSGEWENGTWSFANGTLTILGNGDMEDYRDDPAARPWAEFASEITKVVIGDGVSSVGECAFTRLTNLKTVVCGADVSRLGYDAFSYDPALTDLFFYGPILEIGQGTVYGSSALSSVVLTGQTEEEFLEAASVMRYNENYANASFAVHEEQSGSVSASGTWSRGSWTLENGTLTVSGSGRMPDFNASNPAPWMEYAQDISNVVVGDGVLSVGSNAFSHLTELQSVKCGKDVSVIGMDAFAYSTVREIVFGHKITSIAQGSVYSSNCLMKVTLTEQTKADFLRIAGRTNYNDNYSKAEFIEGEVVSPAYVKRYGTGMENWTGSPNKGKMAAVTQILFCPYEWDENYYAPGLTVTVNMKAVDGSSNDTFTTTVQTAYSFGTSGLCRIEPCLMETPWIPQKDVHYIATFSFTDKDGLPAVCTASDEYYLGADPILPPENNPFDVNGSGSVNILDVSTLLNRLALGDTEDVRDLNGDGVVNIDDVSSLLDYLSTAKS